jgi:hypothetical protein
LLSPSTPPTSLLFATGNSWFLGNNNLAITLIPSQYIILLLYLLSLKLLMLSPCLEQNCLHSSQVRQDLEDLCLILSTIKTTLVFNRWTSLRSKTQYKNYFIFTLVFAVIHFCDSMWSFINWREYVHGFFLSFIVDYVLTLGIQLSRRDTGSYWQV